MKRTSAIAAVTAAALALSLAACGSADSAAASSAPAESTAASTEAASPEAAPSEAAPAGDFDVDQDITVISREDGSGTRGAFIELTGVEEKNADGKKVDNTTEAAAIQSSTNGVMTAVANDETAIGYISLGSLSNDVSPSAASRPPPRPSRTAATFCPVRSTSSPTATRRTPWPLISSPTA